MKWPPQGRERSAINALLTHSTPEFVTRVHGMMDENPGRSMCNILPKIFKCLKEQQDIRNVIH
ncbi:unnamed protein product [Hymenolepis diminuta]|uniref:Uncharacterized protein n=1 Tax=Hymenolepis diminuta TaxID=6216 RepID=A0A564YCP7_HYMDI|nr:unnamed protein product [Hymenolepis diminuta]